jgi:rhomboid protease GluP
VLKGPSAIALYGPAGNQGVLLISTKKTVKIIDQQALKDTLLSLPDSVTDQMTDTEPTKIGTIALDSIVYPWAWIGVKYQKQISNRLDTASKRLAFEQFKKESWRDYSNRPNTGFTYFDNIPYSHDYKEFKDAAKGADCYLYTRKFILLEAKTEPFENRNGQKLPWIFGAFAIGAVIYLLILSFIPLDEDKMGKKESGNSTETIKKDWNATIDFLKPKPGFYATPIIIYINMAVFLLMVFAGLGFIDFEAKDLVHWGANYGPYTTKGQWWRLLTSTFLHAGFMHLILNMYGLLFVGLFLEPVLGKNRFMICYIATGLIASLTSLKMHPQVVSIGASGAIFGMYGIFLALLISKIFPPPMQKAFLTSTLIFVGYNLIIGISGGVDNAAHIGGLISGFVIGLLLGKTIKMEKEET